ncbi:MAG: tetratricopeptide repeat protein [bacterium]|nr:tetratricopeptide repeat protein [bacterium]
MRNRLWVGALAVALPVLTWVFASGQDLSHLLSEARYDEARTLLEATPEPPSTTTDRLDAARLATDPATALIHLEGVAFDADAELRTAALLDRAGILCGAGDFREALRVLQPLLDDDATAPVGQAHLLAGLALRAVGDPDGAERMFASVRPEDPSFAAARIALGDLGLEKGDAHLALRYFDAALETGAVRAQAGRWQARRLLQEDADAASILTDLQRNDRGGIALLEIGRQRHADADAESARRPPAVRDTIATAPVTTAGRYTLQLGAYRDRGLALEIMRRYASRVANLRIDEDRDEHGQILYKVRTGSFVNPARARSEASRLSRDLDVDVYVAEPGR